MGALPKLKNTLAEQCASVLCTKTRQAEQWERSQSTKLRWQSNARPHLAQKRTRRSNGSTRKAQKRAGRAMRVCTLYKNAPGGATRALSKLKITLGKQCVSALCTKTCQAEQRERSQSTKIRWGSNARPHFAQKRTKRSNGSTRKAQKHAGRANRVRTLHKNAPSGAMGALPKHKNTLAEQCASALCTKTHQAEQWECSQSTKTRWQSNARPHFAQKRTKRSNGSAPKAQNYAGRAKCARTLHKNAPSGAMGALAKLKITLAEQNAPALCTKTHQAEQWEHSQSTKLRWQSKSRPHFAQNHTVRDMGVGVSV